jgi:S1-C subfamily serine protease
MASTRTMAGICTTLGCIALLTASPSHAQLDNPQPVPLRRGPWPDSLVLTGPGAQIGASFRNLTASEARQVKLEPFWPFIDRGGVVIDVVRPDSPASRAGLLRGDRITMFDGQRVRNANEFGRLVEETPPGWTVPMTVIRNSKILSLSITPTL